MPKLKRGGQKDKKGSDQLWIFKFQLFKLFSIEWWCRFKLGPAAYDVITLNHVTSKYDVSMGHSAPRLTDKDKHHMPYTSM